MDPVRKLFRSHPFWSTIAVIAVSMLLLKFPSLIGQSAQSLAGGMIRCVLAILLLLLYIKVLGWKPAQLGFRRQGFFKALGLAWPELAFVALIIFIIVTLRTMDMSSVLNQTFAGTAVLNAVEGLSGQDMLFHLLFALTVGLFEETLFRGGVVNLLGARWNSSRKNAIFVALLGGLLFGLVHLTNLISQPVDATLMQVIQVTGTGILWCAIYLRTRNLPALILVHAFHDASLFCISEPNAPGVAPTFSSSLLLAVFYAALGLFYLRKYEYTEFAPIDA